MITNTNPDIEYCGNMPKLDNEQLNFANKNFNQDIVDGDSKWINVNDMMPEKYTHVLVANDDESIFVGSWYGYAWVCPGYFGVSYHRDITHWMPLPKPPKENSDA